MPVPEELQHEVTAAASVDSLLGYALRGYTLYPFEDTVRIERGGRYAYRAYDKLLRDPRVYGAISKRIKETTSKPYDVISASDDRGDTRAAEIVKAQLDHLGYDIYQRRKMGALLKGLTVGEILFREAADKRERETLGTVVFDDVVFRKPWHFRFVKEPNDVTRPLHLHYVGWLAGFGGPAGIDLTEEHPRKFLTYSWGSEYGDPYGKGLGHQLYWPVFFKTQDWKFWLYYNDKHGSPTLDIAYHVDQNDGKGGIDPGSADGKAAIAEAKIAGQKVRQMGVLTHSDVFKYGLLEARSRGDVKTYKDLIDYCDTEIAIATLGSTLTLDLQDQGARSATETHQGDLEALGQDDAEQACQSDTETLVRWISELNVPDATPPRVVRVFPDHSNYREMAQTHRIVVEAVARGLDVDFAERTYKIVIDRKRLGRPPASGVERSGGAEALAGEMRRMASVFEARGETENARWFTENAALVAADASGASLHTNGHTAGA